MHVLSFEYPEAASDSDAAAHHAFLWAAAAVLPCATCRAHFTASLTARVPFADSPVLSGREALAGYLVEVHNDVNRRAGKPEWTLEQARTRYAGGGSVCPIAAPCPAVAAPVPLEAGAGRALCNRAAEAERAPAGRPAAAVALPVAAGIAALAVGITAALLWRAERRR